MLRTLLSLFALACTISACSQSPPIIPISGDPADIAALEGEWSGEYHSYAESGRSGTLYFRLEAGADTARGDVLMHVAGRETAETIPFVGDPWAHAAPDQLLTVTFVRAYGGTISGAMDPYADPVCGCEIETTFTGRLEGNLLEGTYTSTHVNGGDRTTGRWRMHRRLR